MQAIFKRELSAYFSALVGYIIIGLFLLVTGLFIWVFPDSSILEYGYADMQSLFNFAPFLFIFFIPAITMRTFAEERNMGTLEILLTRPVSLWQIIMGKFLACWAIVMGSLLPTIIYYYSIVKLGLPEGNIDGGAVFGSYIGLLLLGGLMVAIGIFASAITSNQIIAFAIAVFLCFIWYMGFDFFSKWSVLSGLENSLTQLGINAHYTSLSRGVIDTRDVLYFTSFSALFLFFTKLLIAQVNEK